MNFKNTLQERSVTTYANMGVFKKDVIYNAPNLNPKLPPSPPKPQHCPESKKAKTRGVQQAQALMGELCLWIGACFKL